VTATLAERLLAGDPRAIARAISLIEDEDPAAADLVRAIFPRSGRAYLIGVTGPPGAGKSTLVDRLIATLKNALNLTVFLVTHDLDSLYAICDRVAVISDHRVVAEGRVGEVERNPDPWIRECFQGPRARSAQARGTGPARDAPA